jgi:hypothetical protein
LVATVAIDSDVRIEERYDASEALLRAASANSSPRKLRALRRIVDDEIGPDGSPELYRYEDAWTIRALATATDKRREGWLMKLCLRGAQLRGGNWLSLRGPDDIPYVTFLAWSIVETDAEVVEALEYRLDFVVPGTVAISGAVGRGNSAPKSEHMERIREFASAAKIDDPGLVIGSYVFVPFPISALTFRAAVNTWAIGRLVTMFDIPRL